MLSRIIISEKLNGELVKISKELIYKAVNYCAERYNFNAEEAYRELGIESMKVECSKKMKVKKVSLAKASLPLPYNGEVKSECCFALRQNKGLYTQCQMVRNGSSDFCKGCANQMQKSGSEVPEYGTIQMRNAVGIFEYVDPKGRKPIAYAKVMNKYKLTKEQVLAEAEKLNIVINPEHFVVPDNEGVKRGRPSKEKETKEKGSRGRPKKSKKVFEADEETDDLFASLVATANEVNEVEEVAVKKNNVSEEEKSDKKAEKEQKKEAERLAREAKKKAEEEEKAAKKAAAEQAKAEKAAKLAAEKAAKEAEKAAKEAEKAAKEAEKAAKKEKAAKLSPEQVKAQKKAEKELKTTKADEEEMAAMKLEIEQVKAVKAHLKAAKKSSPKPSVEEDEEPDVVKKIEFEGKKYLKSKKTGIIYDYNEYTKNGEQVVVGKWNDASNKIVFNNSEEEEDEEEYEA
jgi:hypothetical protein